MKILYVTARWDPRDPDSGAGVNYNVFSTIKTWADEIKIAGPFEEELTFFERFIRKLSGYFSKKRLIKFYPSYIRYCAKQIEKIQNEFQPDVIISKASVPLVKVNLTAPLVYLCDSSVKWVMKEWPHFTKPGFWMMKRWEQKVINKASHILTFSHANAKVLEDYYHKPAGQISVHPIPSSLPHHLSHYKENPIKPNEPIHLLLVGKTYHGKGVDIAVETVQLCNQHGLPAELRIVGQNGSDKENIRFMGLYEKKDSEQLQQYIDQYHWAHFLIFPSRFDAAGIVPSEAAGFGVPTITNAAGGLETTVENGVSGIVLDKHSQPQDYFKVIKSFYDNPEKYQALQQTTYQRYQNELNWNVLGEKLKIIILKAVHQDQMGEN